MRRFGVICLLALIAPIAGAVPALARAGTLDTTFSGDGYVRSLPGLETITDMVVQPDDQILVADDRFHVARLNPNGRIETSFGRHGVAQASFKRTELSTALSLDMEGHVVMVGTAGRGSSSVDHHRLAVARFTSDGRLDRTFSGNGRLVVKCPPRPWCEASAVAIQPDGKIVIAAWYGGFYLIRLNERGGLDRGFGHDGHVNIRRGECCSRSSAAVEVLDGGTIVAAGGGRLARFRSGGALDSSFSNDGMRRLPSYGNPLGVRGLHVYADGTILVAGQDDDWFVARYTGSGGLDQTFARKGWRTFQFRSYSYVEGLVVQPDGRIVIVGYTIGSYLNSQEHPVIARLRPEGPFDPSFSRDGKKALTAHGVAVAVDLQERTTERIVVAGGQICCVAVDGPFALAGYRVS